VSAGDGDGGESTLAWDGHEFDGGPRPAVANTLFKCATKINNVLLMSVPENIPGWQQVD
jgi:hypothetical protein